MQNIKKYKNKKDLNRRSSNKINMKRGRKNNLFKKIEEAQKDPIFIKEINKFIKSSTKIYKLI
jgi:hypothetical protein